MATLRTQYKNYKKDNPESSLSYDEWLKQHGENIATSFQKIFDEVNTPEFKQRQIDENQKYLDELSMDYQLGYFVGERIVSRDLPTLSTDMIHSRRVIEVNEEDTNENNRLNSEWWKSTKYGGEWNGIDESGDKEKWERLFNHNKMLEKKYLPNILDCVLPLIKFENENEFKRGIRWSLWDCDMCSYDIEPENIKIEYDMVLGFTKISFQLR
jgi:hypothetical protein